MRLEQLQYLVEIYRSKSISLAAERAHISQPALSTSISRLEDELKVQLLKRTNQGVYPTEAGEFVIQKSLQIIDALEEISALSRANSDLGGDISLAVELNVNMTFMPKVFAIFRQHFPKANILQKVGESNNILRDVESGKADIGIILQTEELSKAKDICAKEILQDTLVILTSKNNPLANQREISLDSAMAQSIILFNSEYITNCGISGILKKFGNFTVNYRVDTIVMLEKLLLQENGIAFIPRFVAREYMNMFKDLVAITIQNSPLNISIALIWSNRHHLCATEKELIKIIRSVLAT
ncbi:DNA-binding transcriptional LysR family regulator [Anaerospora hongkongensis]|uniref:DNA-binding transcriptional LysR family regulator n=1 Tax=Anaerospora hongkongensis TaxID=244830 RepID=A0A4R1Q7N0_9FIRM|nr:LysR family transcriptional regulator [Anaerospora hongkongensis]TCL37410.1 DNA-binding transcriptional LysR family regulator [Anaerospora hongkongensis]